MYSMQAILMLHTIYYNKIYSFFKRKRNFETLLKVLKIV